MGVPNPSLSSLSRAVLLLLRDLNPERLLCREKAGELSFPFGTGQKPKKQVVVSGSTSVSCRSLVKALFLLWRPPMFDEL